MSAPPTPFHLLRTHSAPLSVLTFNSNNTLLLAGDQDGYISITDLKSRRIVRYWKAHEGGVLGVDEFDGALISHGRDNLINFYEPLTLTGRIGRFTHTDQTSGGAALKVLKSLDVNALNFCRFSLARFDLGATSWSTGVEDLGNGKGKQREQHGLLAVPSLLDSELAEIYHLPSLRRLHASINYAPKPKSTDGLSNRSGLIMSMHLRVLISKADDALSELRLIASFEDGRVEAWSLYADRAEGLLRITDGRTQGDQGWKKVWEGKKHNEAVMAMAVNSTSTKAYTVSADHLLVAYDLNLLPSEDKAIQAWSTKHVGNASVAISHTDQVLAVGGWDGKIRLFSASSGKPLGDLGYHRETVHALSFASAPRRDKVEGQVDVQSTIDLGDPDLDSEEAEEEEEEEGASIVPPRDRWLASGGKDRRIGLWGLKDFSRATT